MSDDKYTMYLIHTLAHTAMIRLHQPFITEDQRSSETALRAASAVVLVVKHIADADFDFLDPLIGVSHTVSFVRVRVLIGFCPHSTAG